MQFLRIVALLYFPPSFINPERVALVTLVLHCMTLICNAGTRQTPPPVENSQFLCVRLHMGIIQLQSTTLRFRFP
jgi:hypothetical protein